MIKLNVGSGHCPLRGFVNIDIRTNVVWSSKVYPVDQIADVCELKKYYKDNSVDVILAKDVLEHLGRNKWKQALQDWVDILKPSGVLKLRVPDTELLFKSIEGNWTDRNKFDRFIQLLFGDQDVSENAHNVGFRTEFLIEDLKVMGMKLGKDPWYDGGDNLRLSMVKGDNPPLDRLDHDDYQSMGLLLVP